MQAKLVYHNAVILKGRRNGITISLDPSISFDELKVHFHRRVVETKQFFEGAKSNVSFTGRKLSEEEEQELLKIITTETSLDVPYVAEQGLFKPSTTSFDTSPAHLPHNIYNTSYHQGGLRSGQSIRYSGSVVVLGDVNPGSEIVAEGNIIVLGALKGMVHAGCTGNEDCFVSGLVFWPTQLRIANIITYIPNDKKKRTPSCAYIQEGQVFVAPLMNQSYT